MLYYPLPGMDVDAIDATYTRLYADYTILKFPPEVFYFAALNQNDFPEEVTIADVYQGFNLTGLYSPKILQDIWLNLPEPGWSNSFTSPTSVLYLRYMALNFGLGGLFTLTTPRS